MALNDDRARHIVVKPWKYWAAVAAVLAPFPALLFSDIFWPSLFGGLQIGGTFLSNSLPLTILLLMYYIAGIKEDHTGQYAGVVVFNQPALRVGPGWLFVPPGIARMKHFPRDIIRMDFPAEKECIFNGEDKDTLPTGMVRPVRIQTGRADDSGPDPLNVQMTLDPVWFVRWHVGFNNFFDFFIRMEGHTWEEHIEYMRKLLLDIGRTILAEEFSKGPVYKVIDDLPRTNEKLLKAYQKRADSYGIIIDEAAIFAPDLTHAVNAALEGIAIAQANAKKTVIAASADRTRLAEEGAGRASAIKSEETARGEGLAAAAKALSLTGAEYFAGDIAKNTLGKGTIVVGTAGITEAIGLGKAALEGLKKKEEPAHE
jgi:regulator of protease activity HflC (stomatin/prohibitin superfamily)